MPNCACPCCATRRLPPPRADRRRALFRLFHIGFDDDVQRRHQLGADRGPALPRQLGGGLPRAQHRRIVRHAVALRPGGRRSLLGLRPRRRRPTSAPIASPTASPPTAATCSSTRSCRWSPAATGSRRRELGKLGLRRGLAAELPAAAVARGQLLQHQGRRRDPVDQVRDAHRHAEVGDFSGCSRTAARSWSSSGAGPGPYDGRSARICTRGSSLPAVAAVRDLLRSAGWDR